MRVCGVEFTCSCSKTYTTYEALLTHAKRLQHAITEKYKNSLRYTLLCLTSHMRYIIIKSIFIQETLCRNLMCHRRRTQSNSKLVHMVLPIGIANKPVAILPSPDKSEEKSSRDIRVTSKTTSDVGVQTDDYRRSKKQVSSPSKLNNGNQHCNAKRRISKQTQTNSFSGKRSSRKSMETQTQASHATRVASKLLRRERGSCRAAAAASKQSEHALLKEDLNLGENFASASLFPASPLPLRHDVGLQDFWEEKNTSGTQTLPEKDMFEAFNDNVTQTEFETLYEHSHNPLIQCVPKSSVALMTLRPYDDTSTVVEGYSFASADGIAQVDNLLTATKTFDDRFSSIETQTEQAFSPSYFYSESLSRSFALSSNIETQTTDNLENMAQLLYNNMCTQTCNEMLPSDLGLSNIQTQTAWTHDADTTVSTETQTKSLICETDCNIPIGACRSWLNTQTSHTETQTDLLHIFEGLE